MILDILSDIFYTKTILPDIASEKPVMSFRERSAWISLIATPLIWGAYFWKIWPDAQDGKLYVDTFGMFVGTLVLLVIVQIVLATVIAIFAGKAADAPMDEREQLIDLKGARVGFHMLNVLLVGVSSLWLYGMSPLVMANGILAAMVIAETLRAASVVFGYRRSA